MRFFRSFRAGMFSICVVVGIFLFVGTILPQTTTTIFASPDETAVAMFARGWTMAEGFRLPAGIPEAIQDIAGLHPRSMVQRGAWLVPVGFLGMPMLVMPFEKMWEGSGAFLTALLVASSVWPLWKLACRVNRRVAFVASIAYLSFPTVLLYANRGLFPNLPVVALGLWSVWLVGEKERWKVMSGGLLFGLALTIRPVEGIWLMPWVVWGFFGQIVSSLGRGETGGIHTFADRVALAGVTRQRVMNGLYGVVALAGVACVGYLASVQTYQSVVPTNGYWLRDVAQAPAASARATDIAARTVDTARVLPFGIHPRTMQTNIRVFWLEMLWPWVILAFAGFVQLWWRKKIAWQSSALWLTVWTGAVLLLFYGQAMYVDNIRGTPAIGNSFLRYMLPLTPLVALAIGAWADAMARSRWRTALVSVTIAALAAYGGWMGLTHDEESILKTRRELQRYGEIRSEAARVLEPGTVVVSERSDKIFAGLPGIVAVSPLPEDDVMYDMWMRDVPIVFFHRQLSSHNAQPFDVLFVNGNERLYRIPSPARWEDGMEEGFLP